MTHKRLFAQVFPWFLFVTLLPAALILAVTWRVIHEFHADRTWQDLQVRVELVRQGLQAIPDEAAAIDAYCRQAGPAARFTVVAPDGRVLGDSLEDPAGMQNHGDRQEVRDALAGRTGRSERFSDTLRKNQLYVALPLVRDGVVVGAVRGAMPVASMRAVVMQASFRILVMVLLTALIAAGIGLYASRLVAEPIEDMEEAAARLAEGDLNARMPVPDSLEMANLAETLNRMAARLNERIRSETRQRREREAVLASMKEGVLALDLNQTVLEVNAAAARLLGVDEQKAVGRSILELVRNPELQRFIDSVLEGESDREGYLVLHDPEELSVQMRGAPLKGDNGQRQGVVVVLNDITRLRRLETVRREFVANASHELRTPITAIRGFAETLVEEAGRNPEAVRKFAAIIESHARRLETLVADMLTLSRLEHLSERDALEREPTPVEHILHGAMAACAAKAEARPVRLEVSCPEGLEAGLAPTLMEQAVANLVDNAIKYSEPGGVVSLSAELAGPDILIKVQDRGCGIERRHLPRLFERFYRADNARSRQLGGTGLGLAIVKHIALAHGGSVGVDSEPGAGSTFTIRIPWEAADR